MKGELLSYLKRIEPRPTDELGIKSVTKLLGYTPEEALQRAARQGVTLAEYAVNVALKKRARSRLPIWWQDSVFNVHAVTRWIFEALITADKNRTPRIQ